MILKRSKLSNKEVIEKLLKNFNKGNPDIPNFLFLEDDKGGSYTLNQKDTELFFSNLDYLQDNLNGLKEAIIKKGDNITEYTLLLNAKGVELTEEKTTNILSKNPKYINREEIEKENYIEVILIINENKEKINISFYKVIYDTSKEHPYIENTPNETLEINNTKEEIRNLGMNLNNLIGLKW